MSTVIKVESLSKQYRLGSVGTGTLSHDINRLWHKIQGKEDPFFKIGEENDRTTKGSSNYVWALKDINFEVGQGNVLGIVGRNGAGKSTLLKILSRTTTPTTGNIKIKGRIASLLEVGTGFHPELSGRENIFLNGAILGMTRHEIKRKFDNIVDFAGVERYIDTPVKRYSSGMYVRLAFAVAAHLEPEILIVDEVLAVGDVEFQKKALGKMKDVSNNQGRTVLFVSHNLPALKKICDKGIILENGMLVHSGSIEDSIDIYNRGTKEISIDKIAFKSTDVRINVDTILINGLTNNHIKLESDAVLYISIIGTVQEDLPIEMQANLFDDEEYPLAFYSPGHVSGVTKKITKGDFQLDYTINLPQNMNSGIFHLKIGLSDPGHHFYGETSNQIVIAFDGITIKSGLVFNAKKNGWLLIN